MARTGSLKSKQTQGLNYEMELSCRASLAAFELDDLMLDRAKGFTHIQKLAQELSQLVRFPQDLTAPTPDDIPLLDPRVVVVVNEAIINSRLYQQPSTVLGMIEQASKVIERLTKLVAIGNQSRKTNEREKKEVKKMFSFCLALSNRAATAKPSPYEEQPWHFFP